MSDNSAYIKERPRWVYRLVIASAACIWGLGFIIGKGAIAQIGSTWFTSLRFFGAGIVLLIVLFPHVYRHFNRRVLKVGAIIGVFTFFGFWTQFIGLSMTTPSKNAFLSACYCVTVPFIMWVFAHKRPNGRTLAAAFVCAVGIGFVSLNGGFSISPGDTMSIVSAFAYGAEIAVIGIVIEDNDVLTVTVVQQFVAGALAAVAALFMQPLPAVEALTSPDFLLPMAYVIVLSGAYGAFAQNLGQAHVSASEAGLLCSLESVFCAFFSVAFFGEALTASTVIGFVLIFAAITVTQVSPADLRKRKGAAPKGDA